MKRKYVTASLISVSAFTLILLFLTGNNGCGSNDNSNPNPITENPNQVLMKNIAYSPATITVSVGTTVTWVNNDGVSHTVTSGTPGNSTGPFDSSTIPPGGKFNFKFDSKGTFKYYCTIHPSQMQATVIVQ